MALQATFFWFWSKKLPVVYISTIQYTTAAAAAWLNAATLSNTPVSWYQSTKFQVHILHTDEGQLAELASGSGEIPQQEIGGASLV